MKFSISLNCDKSLNPNIVYYLKNLPDHLYLGKHHSPPIRHPGGIFNYSLTKIIETISEYFELKKQLEELENKGELYKKINKCIEKLIHNICSFEDEAYLILVSLCPVSSVNSKFAYEWLKKNEFSKGADHFRSSTSHVMELWNEINNRIKHNNQKLSAISVTDDIKTVFGFYVEGTNIDGAIGPDKIIHEKYLKGAVGLSYDRTVLTIFAIFYFLSDKLSKSLKVHLKEYHKTNFTKSKEAIATNEKLELIFKTFSEFEYLFFPKEYKLKFPMIKRQGNIYQFSYPHGDILFHPKTLKVSATFIGDGYSNKFNIPGSP